CSLKFFWKLSLPFWNLQGCITVYLSRFYAVCFSAATLLYYHRHFPLSTAFSKFFQTFLQRS
ncbi:MAG: hypothetical protein E7291_10290, partial [Lachnospiraceae bacterium]|nr:hypothetical protein [Lachnospiraceae bacterium]